MAVAPMGFKVCQFAGGGIFGGEQYFGLASNVSRPQSLAYQKLNYFEGFNGSRKVGPLFIAMMCSVLGTLASNGIDVLRWLETWLTTCAKNDGRAPGDLSTWLSWSMSGEHRRALMTPWSSAAITDATTNTRGAPNRIKISGSVPSGKTGNERSTAKTGPPSRPGRTITMVTPTHIRRDTREL